MPLNAYIHIALVIVTEPQAYVMGIDLVAGNKREVCHVIELQPNFCVIYAIAHHNIGKAAFAVYRGGFIETGSGYFAGVNARIGVIGCQNAFEG